MDFFIRSRLICFFKKRFFLMFLPGAQCTEVPGFFLQMKGFSTRHKLFKNKSSVAGMIRVRKLAVCRALATFLEHTRPVPSPPPTLFEVNKSCLSYTGTNFLHSVVCSRMFWFFLLLILFSFNTNSFQITPLVTNWGFLCVKNWE